MLSFISRGNFVCFLLGTFFFRDCQCATRNLIDSFKRIVSFQTFYSLLDQRYHSSERWSDSTSTTDILAEVQSSNYSLPYIPNTVFIYFFLMYLNKVIFLFQNFVSMLQDLEMEFIAIRFALGLILLSSTSYSIIFIFFHSDRSIFPSFIFSFICTILADETSALSVASGLEKHYIKILFFLRIRICSFKIRNFRNGLFQIDLI